MPQDQLNVAKWSLERTKRILAAPSAKSWMECWLAEEPNDIRPTTGALPFGLGDGTSIFVVEKAVEATRDCGAVRHGAECFNFGVPQDLDDEYLIIWNGFSDSPWDYKSEEELRLFLSHRISEGFSFPLNPVWTVRDPPWYNVLAELRSTESAQQPLASWYPPSSGLLETIDALHKSYPHGFKDDEDVDRSLEKTDLMGITNVAKIQQEVRVRERKSIHDKARRFSLRYG